MGRPASTRCTPSGSASTPWRTTVSAIARNVGMRRKLRHSRFTRACQTAHMSTEPFPSTVGASAEAGPLDVALRVIADSFDVDPPYVHDDNDLDATFPDRFLD